MVRKTRKVSICLSIDTDISLWLRAHSDFNVSKFLNEMLRKTQDIKEVAIPKEDSKLEAELLETKIKLQLLESEDKKRKEQKEEEASQWRRIEPRGESEGRL